MTGLLNSWPLAHKASVATNTSADISTLHATVVKNNMLSQILLRPVWFTNGELRSSNSEAVVTDIARLAWHCVGTPTISCISYSSDYYSDVISVGSVGWCFVALWSDPWIQNILQTWSNWTQRNCQIIRTVQTICLFTANHSYSSWILL